MAKGWDGWVHGSCMQLCVNVLAGFGVGFANFSIIFVDVGVSEQVCSYLVQ
jgi:hypothetical protein